jgi:hypothetical protein
MLSAIAGLVPLGVGAATLWRTRRVNDSELLKHGVGHTWQGQHLGTVARYAEFVAAMTIRFVFLPPRLVSGARGLLV